jgi:hypothetical protein
MKPIYRIPRTIDFRKFRKLTLLPAKRFTVAEPAAGGDGHTLS